MTTHSNGIFPGIVTYSGTSERADRRFTWRENVMSVCTRLLCMLLLSLLALLSVDPLGANAAADPDDSLEDMQSEADWVSTYPRLYFTPERLRGLRKRISTDVGQREAWQILLERADQLLTEELVSKEYAEGGTGQHGNYGRPSAQIAKMGTTLGLAYQMTGKEAYAEKLREALLHYCQLSRWAGDAKRDPPWNSELNTARFCFGYAVGYDSIHDYLSESDRAAIVEALVQRGILPTLNDWVLPEERIHALDSMGHNWWSVCASMGGVAALSIIGEETRAEDWATRVRDVFPEWFAYQGNTLQNKSPNFDSKGAFYESVAYANYALSEYLLFRLAYANVHRGSSPPEIPLLSGAGAFFIHAAYPTSDSLLSVNFGDSSLSASGARTLHLLLANGFGSPEYGWYLSRSQWGADDPIGLTYPVVRSTPEPPSALPTSMAYPDIGWVMMRSSWEDNATLLAVKSGFTWNHAHPDAGSFVLFHGGSPLIIDSGNCSYSRPEYTSYYRHSKAHNVILVDGEAQNPEDCAHGDRGVRHPGHVLHLMDMAGVKYVLADATGPTSWKFSRNYRHFLWIDDVILIVDDIRAHQPGQLEWLLHYEGEARIQETDVHLSNGEQSQAIVRFLHPKGSAIASKPGLKDHDPDTPVEYLALSPGEKAREMKFITAILLLDEHGEVPAVDLELLEGDEMLGVRIARNTDITEVFLNLRADGRRMHRNSNKTIHGWETDAYIFGTTRPAGSACVPESISRCFVICGSYLRKDGEVMLDSLSKVYSIFSARDETIDVTLQGQPIVNCEIRAQDEPLQTTLNGKPAKPAWDEERRTIRFQWAGGDFE